MLRVLIVDDDPDVLTAVESVLKQEFEVVAASNGLDALEKIERVEPDLAIMDVSMPCLNGFDTARSIRKNARFRHLPIIYLTASDDPESRAAARELGASLYFTKPFDPRTVLERLTAYVKEANLKERNKQFTVEEILAAEREGAELTPPPKDGELVSPGRQRGLRSPETGELKPRVMVIDDEPDVAELIESFLSPLYEVVCATHSIDALEKIIQAEPDLILLDIEMPNLSGYALSRLLKLNAALSTIRIMFVSSRDQPQEIEYGFRLGAADYLTKPFTAQELIRRVGSIVENPGFVIRQKERSLTEILHPERAGSGHETEG